MENSKGILALLAIGLVLSIGLVFLLQQIGPTLVAGDLADPSTDPREDRSGCVVGPVPQGFPFDPFYEKYCDAGGIPIISSGDVSDLALQQAYYIASNMLAPVPDMRAHLVSRGVYFAVIGMDEDLADLPEYSHLGGGNREPWARGLSATPDNPITSVAEENLLCMPRDYYYGESIAVHEIALMMAQMGDGADFDSLVEQFNTLYLSAVQEGLWRDTFAISSIEAYWAEGVQSYFNANLESDPADGIHNHVNTRQELAEYDPHLYDFIAGFFNGYEWTPTCPQME